MNDDADHLVIEHYSIMLHAAHCNIQTPLIACMKSMRLMETASWRPGFRPRAARVARKPRPVGAFRDVEAERSGHRRAPSRCFREAHYRPRPPVAALLLNLMRLINVIALANH